MKNNPHAGFGRLFDHLVVRTPLLLLTPGQVGISQAEQKNNKKTTEGGRKKRQNTIQNSKT